MCSSVIWLLLLLTQLGASESPCSKLQHDYRPESTDMIEVLVSKKPVETVVRGSGGAARAAAALLFVAIRRVRGYRASLNTTFVHLCDLLEISDFTKNAVVAPAVTWSHCYKYNQGSVDMLTSVSRPAAVSSELRLWAYVPSDSCFSKADGLEWSFFTNYNKVQECDFIISKKKNLKSNGNSSNYFAVLARNESSNDNEIATELQKRIQATNLQLEIVYFKSDFLMRKKILELTKLEKAAFLFLDENLWSGEKHMINVQPPPCANISTTCTSDLNPVSAFRVGNGMFMDQFAPPISKLVNNFSPKASQLREILKIETEHNDFHIEDAACSWALEHKKEFQNMISYNSSDDLARSIFDIIIILCESDPLNNVFENVTNLINSKILKKQLRNIDFQIHLKLVYCYDKDSLELVMTEIIKKIKVAGVIAWGWSEGVLSAANVAERGQLPLLLVGPVAPKVQLGHSVQAVTGLLTDLTRALHYILNICEWSRIAILSDNSSYSKSFVLNLAKQKKLLYRDEIVNYTNIHLQLDELEKADARIFLLNVNWSISCQILCAALKRGMTPKNGFVWIARDWRSLECCNNNSWDSMYHYTINFGWQGENVRSGSKSLQDELRHFSSRKLMINSDPSILADALLQLGYVFGNFHKTNLLYGYYLRNSKNTLHLSKYFENITTMGVAQELKNKNFTLQNPLIFINKWQGVTVQPVGVLKINQNNVLSERPINAICKTLFGNQLVRDRPHCATITTGDPFSPRCHDETIFVVAVLLILLITALYMARRNRLKLLLNRELNIIASLLEIRKQTATSLDMYLVNRNAIKLLHEIGSGTFGRVHFAELQRSGQSTVVVAAKEPRKDIGPTEECEFFHEACVLAPLCHDNIIRLVGICIMNGPPTVLMEHAFYLDLKRYLTERRHLVSGEPNDIDRAIEVSDESLTRLACEAAGAVTYLTTRRLVHRDIRAANCLIDKKRSLKLGDFGMARELDVKAPEYATIRRALFPVLWMAPESLQLGVFSFATDIWSLGVLIMEVVTLGSRPYGDWQPTRVLNYVTSGGRPPLPPDVSKQTSSLLHSCWESKAELRPSASWVHKYLQQNPRALSPALLKPYPPDPPIINIE